VTLPVGVTLDSTVIATAGIGTEQLMPLISRGDTIDTRLIIRFDTIPHDIASTGATITAIDSVYLRFHFDSSAKNVTAPVTISLYDVDSAGIDDTSATALAVLFTPARLLGSRTLAAGKAVDTVSVQLANALVLDKVVHGKHLRVGVQVTSTQPVSMLQPAAETSLGERLYMRVSSDFTVPSVTLAPNSKLVANDYESAASLRDFTIVVAGTPVSAGSMLAVGGIPATRTYFRFNIPSQLVDSSIVVRATLLLTQVPSGSPDGTDTMFVIPFGGIAGPIVTDPTRAAQITIAQAQVPFEHFIGFPSSSGQQEIEIVPAFNLWAAQTEADLPRQLILQSSKEGTSPQRILFYSSEAVDPTVQPQLRISYTPRTRIGTP
jgi:hypothetical protein